MSPLLIGSALFALLFWSSALGILFIILRPGRYAYIFFAVQTLIALLIFPFFFGWQNLLVPAAVIFGLSLWWAHRRVQREQEIITQFFFLRLARRGLPLVFTGLALLLAVVYGISPAGLQGAEPQVPKIFFEFLTGPAESVLDNLVPGYRKGMTVGEIQGLAGGLGIDTGEPLPPGVGNQGIADFAHETLNENLRNIIAPYKDLMPLFYTIGLFLVFKALSVPLLWLSVLLAWVALKIFLWQNILRIAKVGVKKEILVYVTPPPPRSGRGG